MRGGVCSGHTLHKFLSLPAPHQRNRAAAEASAGHACAQAGRVGRSDLDDGIQLAAGYLEIVAQADVAGVQ